MEEKSKLDGKHRSQYCFGTLVQPPLIFTFPFKSAVLSPPHLHFSSSSGLEMSIYICEAVTKNRRIRIPKMHYSLTNHTNEVDLKTVISQYTDFMVPTLG